MTTEAAPFLQLLAASGTERPRIFEKVLKQNHAALRQVSHRLFGSSRKHNLVSGLEGHGQSKARKEPTPRQQECRPPARTVGDIIGGMQSEQENECQKIGN